MGSKAYDIQRLRSLTEVQKSLLKKNNYLDTSELILASPTELSKKLRISQKESQTIIKSICGELASSSLHLVQLSKIPDDKFTTGDAAVDEIIGGGIRTGMVWELVGESASGKTQLALQLSLLVQTRPMLGGLSGAACYITTNSKLPTKRLTQLIEEHPLLSPSICSLSDIYTLTVPTIELLLHTLRETLPNLQQNMRREPTKKPIRLIVIDAVSSLFRSFEKSSSMSLFERSKLISELSRIMHVIATKDDIAFVVLNEVTDIFDNETAIQTIASSTSKEVSYKDQARWFNSAHSFPGENSKEAVLGLVWANQLNARIMLTRTNRYIYKDDTPPTKRRRVADDPVTSVQRPHDSDLPMLVRRLSVVFNSISYPSSIDFCITATGLSAIENGIEEEKSINPKTTYIPPIVEPEYDDGYHSLLVADKSSQSFVNAREANLEQLADNPENSEDVSSLEVIPSTFPEEELVGLDGVYWEQFEEMTQDDLADIDFDELEGASVLENIHASQSFDDL